ncbi:ATP-binding cassette domain-containing protein [Companilactobacillus zhachilii]|uniref:ATP-binding cassette domain-containing protein n=1 Tax=Companilactobacillus zhachilii TaxID=2304606 RepID=UPI0019234AD3|nr:ATP-binding cassette domain-containing protein [Companilactobacillus zhachilii]MBL3531848.1 ATP-binding cassette domain-containing protein [Companilactobacillus zhachilii]
MKLISVNDLSLQDNGYFAFKHVAFSLSQNEIIGINGDNGSGKTTLLEAIANHQAPDSGEIEYTPGVRIGYMPQVNPQVIDQSVLKYLESIRRLSKDLAVRPEQMQGMITFLGMSPYLDQPVRQLSVGLQRRVDFLAAVVGHPNVLLLDEPFIFQTTKTVKSMLSLIQDLKDNGSGVVIAGTHFDEMINHYLDNGYFLKDNRLEKIASTTNKEVKVELIFSVHPNSVAVTSDIERYITSNLNNVVTLTLPVSLKNAMVEKMTRLNYQLEGEKRSEN